MAVREGKTTTGNAVSRRGEAYPNPTTHTNYAIFYIFSKMSLEAFLKKLQMVFNCFINKSTAEVLKKH